MRRTLHSVDCDDGAGGWRTGTVSLWRRNGADRVYGVKCDGLVCASLPNHLPLALSAMAIRLFGEGAFMAWKIERLIDKIMGGRLRRYCAGAINCLGF